MFENPIEASRLAGLPVLGIILCKFNSLRREWLFSSRPCRVLEEAGINVAMMNLSRREISGKAVSLLTVDQSIPDAVMEQLRQDPRILSARQVNLHLMADELHPLQYGYA